MRAQPAHQPLRQHRLDGGGQQVVLDPHVEQPGHRRGRRIRMHGRQHEMAGQRRLHRDLRGFEIADLADHHDVGILPQDRAQRAGEIEPDLRLDLDLVDAGELVLDRILDGHDIAGDRVQLEQPGVERRRLAAARRPGDQHHAVRQLEGALEALPDIRRQAELLVVELDGGAVEHAQHDLFAVQRGYRTRPESRSRGRARVSLMRPSCGRRRSAMSSRAMILMREMTAALQPRRRRFDLVQHAVIPVAHPEPVRQTARGGHPRRGSRPPARSAD